MKEQSASANSSVCARFALVHIVKGTILGGVVGLVLLILERYGVGGPLGTLTGQALFYLFLFASLIFPSHSPAAYGLLLAPNFSHEAELLSYAIFVALWSATGANIAFLCILLSPPISPASRTKSDAKLKSL